MLLRTSRGAQVRLDVGFLDYHFDARPAVALAVARMTPRPVNGFALRWYLETPALSLPNHQCALNRAFDQAGLSSIV